MKNELPKMKKTQALTAGGIVDLFVREPVGGYKPCPGEAHGNAHIDHCMICLNSPFGWGRIQLVREPTVQDVLDGKAVPCGFIGFYSDEQQCWREAEKAGQIKMVAAHQKGAHFYVYVKA